MNYLNLIFAIEIFLLLASLLLLRGSGGNLLEPSVIVYAVFLISTGFAVVNQYKWNINFSVETFTILLSGLLVFFFVDIFNCYVESRIPNRSYSAGLDENGYIYVDRNYLKSLGLFCIISAILFYGNMYLICLPYGGGNFLSTVTIFRRLQTSSSVSADTSFNSIVALINRCARAICYVMIYVFLHNLDYCEDDTDKKENRYYALFVLYIIFQCYCYRSRGEYIKLITYAFATSYIGKCQKNNWQASITEKYILKAVIIIMIFIPMFYVMAILVNRMPEDMGMIDYLASYIGGSIQCFNLFVQNPYYSDGLECFSGINSLLLRLGIISEKPSTHLEFRWLTSSVHGNVYTFFRSPLHDFGFAGMLVFTFIVASGFSIYYNYFIRYKESSYKTNLYVILYSYLLPWLTMSSIAQMSVSYISIGNIIEIAFLVILYKRIVANGVPIILKLKNLYFYI